MKTFRGEIVIFKAPSEEYEKDGADVYKSTLEEAGICTFIVPVLTFEFFDLDKLREKLLRPENYSGLIFTSPRTVKAVSMSLEGETLPDLGWKNAFIVGETTGQILRRDLKIEEIQGTKDRNLPLLYPCGTFSVEPGGDRLGPALALGGLQLDPVPSYRTCPHPGIEGHLKSIMDKGLPEIVAFFSPSGVRFATSAFQKLGIELADFKIVAIGPTTEAALKTARLPVWATADKPTPQHLTDAIVNHL